MKLQVYRALCGMTGPAQQQLERVAEAGYDGFVVCPGHVDITRDDALRLAARLKLHIIVGAGVKDRKELDTTLSALADYNPVKINLHSGQDCMGREEGCAFFEEALRVEEKIGIPVAHETHRGR